MLTRRLLVAGTAVTAAEVRCGGHDLSRSAPRSETRSDTWSDPEPADRFAVVLVRSGLFRRRVDGQEATVDAGSAYLQRPGTEQQVAHPRGADVCTSLAIGEAELDALGVDTAADLPFLTPREIDLAHRALVARARYGARDDELEERANVLAGAVLSARGAVPVGIAPGPLGARRAVEVVREALEDDVAASLSSLARSASVSSYHLSRVFHRETGLTISAFRARLRVRRALDELAGGETDLAALAARTGFADQAHLTRLVRAETGSTPGALRELFGGGRS